MAAEGAGEGDREGFRGGRGVGGGRGATDMAANWHLDSYAACLARRSESPPAQEMLAVSFAGIFTLFVLTFFFCECENAHLMF